MSRLIPSKFLVYKDSHRDIKWGNYVNENILLATHQGMKKTVDLTDTVMKYAAGSLPSLSGKKATLWDSLIGEGRVREVDADEVEWSLKGSGQIETMATENVMPGVKYPGHNHQEFQIKLDTEVFVPGDILAPEIAKDVNVIVQYLPVKDGIEDFIYTVVIADMSEDAYFEPELLEPGLKWIKIGATYGEASDAYGSTYFQGNTSYIRFKSDLSEWGKKVEVTNKADQLRLKAVDVKGFPMKQFPDQIISMIEAEFLAQAKWEKELMIWYGRAIGKTVIDPSSGYHRRMGPGVMEFLEDSNIITYPLGNFSIDMIRDFLQEVGWDTISPENSNIVVKTGRMGMTQADKAIREIYSRLNIQVPFDKWVTSGSKYPGGRGEGFRVKENYFLEVDFFPYGSIRFEHLPLLDNRELNGGQVHPETGLPLTSYYYFIMDYGLGSAGNVELLRKRDSEIYTYICGTWSPVGPINGATNRSGYVASHTRRSYELVAADSFGVRIKDVNLCAMLLPAVQY